MSKPTKRKYIESHWLVFAVQGVLTLLFGWYVMFTNVADKTILLSVVGFTMLGMSIIELCNLYHRHRMQHDWGLTLVIAIIEMAVSLTLLSILNVPAHYHLIILAVYTLLRGLFEIFISFKSMTDATDKFMWLVCGICGVIMGFVILNSGHMIDTTTFIRFFGSYMMIYGITALIYGVHSKNEAIEDKESRKKLREARTLKKTTKKTASKKK